MRNTLCITLFLSIAYFSCAINDKPASLICEIDVEQHAHGKIKYGACSPKDAQNNVRLIRKAINEAKKNDCQLIFPNQEIHLSPVFTSNEIYKDFHRIKNGSKNDYIKGNDYYTYSFFDLTDITQNVEGNDVRFKVSTLELYDIIVNQLVAKIQNVCIENSLWNNEELNNPQTISKFAKDPIIIDEECNKEGVYRLSDILQNELKSTDGVPNSSSGIKRILRHFWFSVITINECQADNSFQVKNLSVEDIEGGLITNKRFVFIGDQTEYINELVNGVYITRCVMPDAPLESLSKEKAKNLSILHNVRIKGLGNGVKIQSSRNLVISGLDASFFTDTGFNLNNSTNCWLYDSTVSGGSDGNCTMYGGNIECGFKRSHFSDLGRSYQLIVIEGSENCQIIECTTSKDVEPKNYFGGEFDANANHRAIIINRSQNTIIKDNVIDGAETGITVRCTDIVDNFVFDPKVRNHSSGTIISNNHIKNLRNYLNKNGRSGSGPVGIYLETSKENTIMENEIHFEKCGTFVLFADRGKTDPFEVKGHCTSISNNKVWNNGPDIIDFSYTFQYKNGPECKSYLYNLEIINNEFHNTHLINARINLKANNGWALSRHAFDFYHVELMNAAFQGNKVFTIEKGNCDGKRISVTDSKLSFIGNGKNVSFSDNKNIQWIKNNRPVKFCNKVLEVTNCQ